MHVRIVNIFVLFIEILSN